MDTSIFKQIRERLIMDDVIAESGIGVTIKGKRRFILCPWHGEKTPSAELCADGKGYCHACNKSFDSIDLWAELNGLMVADAVKRLSEKLNLKGAERMVKAEKSKFDRAYDYKDESGQLLYQVCRMKEPKGFYQRQPKEGGGWKNNLEGVRPVPYRLPELLEGIASGQTVYVVEGEKDADRLASFGLIATCNNGGAGKWTEEHSAYIPIGSEVVILPDNDKAGRDHADKVKNLLLGRGCRVRVVALPDLREHGDVSDWLEAGGDISSLLALIGAAPYSTVGEQTAGGEAEGGRPKSRSEDGERKSQADKLLELMIDSVSQYFKNEVGEQFVTFAIDGATQTHSAQSSTFRSFLTGLFYKEYGKAVSPDAVRQVVAVAEAKATFEGQTRNTSLRCMATRERVIYDLADDLWQAVEVTSAGWSVVPAPPEMIRGANTAPQVRPIAGGKIGDLRKILNVKNENDFVMVAVWLAYCIMCPDLPKPIVCLHGSKGSGKSSFQRVLRKLIDPAKKELEGLPADEASLALRCAKNYLLSFDNLSKMSAFQSDLLCTVSTGGGFSKRKLYTNDEEIIQTFCRPVTLSGINTVAERSDLLDRCLLVELERIDVNDRREDSDLTDAIDRVKPSILGAIFDAVTFALSAEKPQIPLLRMADFTAKGYLLAEAFGFGGETFLSALSVNEEGTLDAAMTASPVVVCLLELLERNCGRFDGSASELFARLRDIAYDTGFSAVMPKSAAWLVKQVRPMVTDMKSSGISVEVYVDRHTKRTRFSIARIEDMPAADKEKIEKVQNVLPFSPVVNSLKEVVF